MSPKLPASVLALFFACIATAQSPVSQPPKVKVLTRADTLRGTITPERAWWDVVRYDVTVTPDYNNKSITGISRITYTTTTASSGKKMQIDLQEPLVIDSILLNKTTRPAFTRDGNAWFLDVPEQKKSTTGVLEIFYHGAPARSWKFIKDSLDRPWMTAVCQGLGASSWYPCKDHQSDEPDKGASLTIIVPDTLKAIANGRLLSEHANNDGTTTYKWGVVNPISTYCLIPYIGKYVNFSDQYDGLKGKLDLNFWVLDYNAARAKDYMLPQVHAMMKSMEHWYGPYPFYEDGYKLVDAPNAGMEHQSAVSYGNKYKFGYLGRDESGTGWGLKWDFIIVHESGHEWFGNNITAKDQADMWVHEGFTNYSETMFVDYTYGKEAGNLYNAGDRRNIKNDRPIIARYGVNDKGSIDMYYKSGNMLHAIRHSMDDDEKFIQILHGLTKTFYHQTVTTQQIETYFSKQAGFDYQKVFDQYLRTTQIPRLEFSVSEDGKKVSYRWTNCVSGFNLPLVLTNESSHIKILPTEEWKTSSLKDKENALFNESEIVKMYYITAMPVSK